MQEELISALLINVVVQLLGAELILLDKSRARLGRRRIPENTLHLFGFLSGGILMGICMRIVRHKTSKPKFLIPFVILSIIGTALWLTVPWFFF